MTLSRNIGSPDTLPSPQTSPGGVTISQCGGTGAERSPDLPILGDCLRHRSGGLRPEPRAASQPFGRSSTGAQPMVPDSPRLFGPSAGAIDLNAIAHQENRLQTAPLSELVLEHAELSRWLDQPYAELWADQHAEKSARIKAVWQAIKRRSPEYAAKMERRP